MTDLTQKHCVPCEGGTPPLSHDEATAMVKQIPGWELHEVAPSLFPGREHHFQIEREFKFKNFKEAMAFVNRVAELAEKEKHHPDMLVHGWNKLHLTLVTHAIGGLSENDFILAAKINAL